jgi:hypothetical protein
VIVNQCTGKIIARDLSCVVCRLYKVAITRPQAHVAITTLLVSIGGTHRVVGVDASLERWGAISHQQEENQDCSPCHSDSALAMNAGKRCNAGKHEGR